MLCKSVLLVSGYLLLVNGYPNGAPDDVCFGVGIPQHNVDAQDIKNIPYNVVASSASYSPGSEIQLTISGKEFFRGFFFQAFDIETDKFIGDWIATSESRLVKPCGGVTQVSPTDKYSVTLTWKYTGDQSGELYFKGSIVRTYQVLWINVVAIVQ